MQQMIHKEKEKQLNVVQVYSVVKGVLVSVSDLQTVFLKGMHFVFLGICLLHR